MMLAPTRQSVNHSHYGLADDLPPQTLFVTVPDKFGEQVPFTPGPMLLTGTLSVGNKQEPDGCVSVVRVRRRVGPARALSRAHVSDFTSPSCLAGTAMSSKPTHTEPMKNQCPRASRVSASAIAAAALFAGSTLVDAAPVISRLTPPSALFSSGDPNPPIIARFLPGQRFDMQVTVRPDAAQTITGVQFFVDDDPVPGTVSSAPATAPGLPPGTTIFTLRAYTHGTAGIHSLKAIATQSDGEEVEAAGNFEIVAIDQVGRRAKNVIFCIGEGMGIAHRTAARLMLHGAHQGKSNGLLAMDKFPVTGIVTTHSLNSIVTDSSPGAACYSTGNKSNNNQQGVFPDDTTDSFDNPRVELIGEYLARTGGKSLGIVTTSDVFDATPGAFGTHTANRSAGTGICDQYLDEAAAAGGLRVLLGGGRKWFLPQGASGSQRSATNDYVLPAELASGWGVPAGAIDPARDLLADFQAAGFTYSPDATSLNELPPATTRLLGLYAFSNMNVAKGQNRRAARRHQRGR